MSSLAASRADGYYYPKEFYAQASKFNTLNQFNQAKGIVKPKCTKPPVRFEMMFDVQCLGCRQSIGKGVRFNATKIEVGKYLGTKIFDF